MAKDWIGNENAVKSTIGIAVFKDSKREDNDFYATEPKALELLLDIHKFSKNVWECACGCNTLVNVLKKRGFNVRFSDIKARKRGIEKLDFLSSKNKQLYNGDIITNPPYKFASEFIIKGLSLLKKGKQLALFMPTRYLSGQKRGEIFKKYPPKIIWVASKRFVCSKNGDFTHNKAALMDYAWFIWEKGFKGKTTVDWFN